MSILIKKAGVLDSVQDLGRNGFRKFGINPNGAMDRTAVRLINILLENDENEAVLEMHFPTSEITFKEDAIFAIGGASFSARLAGNAINNWEIQTAKNGETLKFAEKICGSRIYLSIKNGFNLDKWLDSSSTNLTAEVGGFNGRKLINNDEINFNSKVSVKKSKQQIKIGQSLIPAYSKSPTIRIVKGAEYRHLTALSEEMFLSNNYKISPNSNRMGFRLEGRELHLLDEKELVSSAVDFGTIQLLPDGQMIALMADHQTTGGYPRIAHIVKQDLPLFAQLNAGDNVSFSLINLQQAEELNLRLNKDLNLLKMGVKFSKS